MIRFRCVRPEDASDLADIYAPFVRDTAVSFEFVPPAAGEMAARIREITALYPWIVCEADGKMAGYAYASALHKRPAYGWNAELSLYLSPAFHRRGIGSALLQALLELLRMQGFQYAYACITASNDGSIRLHRRFGFEPVGRFPRAGYKGGAWHDVLWLARPLNGEGNDGEPSPVRPLPSLPEAETTRLLERWAATCR